MIGIALEFEDNFLEEQWYEEEYRRECNMHQVTREMAMDACDLSLEGTWI